MSGATNSNDETVASAPAQPVESESEQCAATVESNNENLSKYKDYSGVDTESFIIQTLREHPKDRSLLLSLEKFFQDFIQDDQQAPYQFQAMNSYERMIVHRVAAYFGLQHNTDKNGQCVVISKTSTMRIPDLSFQTVIENEPAETTAAAATRPLRETRKPPRSIPSKAPPSSSQFNQPMVPMNPMTMPNYVPWIPANGSAYYGAHGIPLTPIFIHPAAANGPIQYLYPTDRPFTPIYRSDLLPPTPFVPFQYPTNQFAALTLQSPLRPLTTPLPPRNYLGRPFVQSSAMTKKSRPPKSKSD